jgi:hypothetical protein
VYQKFSFNERVAWVSQSQGIYSRKEGIVVAVVPPGKFPRDTTFRNEFYVRREDGEFKYRLMFKGPVTRTVESYLIMVQDEDRPKLYWPWTKFLVKVNQETKGNK